jgi:putative FmdB family regulatory protein
MPLYEYRCDSCTMVFEELVSSHSAAVKCPNCGSRGPTRVLSTFAAHGGGGVRAEGSCGEGACATPGVGRASGHGGCGGACGCGH